MRQEQEADALGERLFFDRCGPLADYPSNDYLPRPGDPRTSWSGIADDPDDPARLVAGLGIHRRRLPMAAGPLGRAPGPDRGRQVLAVAREAQGIRLLGRQPLDAADVGEVTQVFLACHVLDPRYNHAFSRARE